MGCISNEAKIYNSMETNEIRKGGDTAIAVYNATIDKISEYEIKSKLKKEEIDISVTPDILNEIIEQVSGRETIGEIPKEENVYINEEKDIEER